MKAITEMSRGELSAAIKAFNAQNRNIIWAPQPKQTAFLCRWENEVLYGGAAGGGKSDALLAEALRQVEKRHYKAIIFRKTYPELEDLILRSHEIYKAAYPGARYNDNKHVWVFPSGARVYFGAMQHKKDRTKYQGKQYAYIAFDELTHFLYDEYIYMFSRCRSPDPDIRCYIRAATNPGGIGHGWVKQRFIDGALPGETRTEVMEIAGEKYQMSRTFIQATVFDNYKLLDADPMYIPRLAMLPKAEQEALLYGKWDSFAGQAFTEWRNDPKGYASHKFTHVIEPFKIPAQWRRYRSFDWGYAKPFSVGYWAESPDGILYRYHEIYGTEKDERGETKEPNKGIYKDPATVAKLIKEYETKHEKGSYITGVADPSIFDESRGSDGSVGKIFERAGLFFEKGDNERLAGKQQLHWRLNFDQNGRPGLYVFRTCRDFIRTLPNLVYDVLKVEDIDTDGEDHAYDEARYLCMYRPIKPTVPKKVPVKPPQDDPLDMIKPRQRY